MKKRLGPSDRIYPMPCPLVAASHDGESDLMAVAWIGIASTTPPTVAASIRSTRRTLELIRASGEFTVNVPPTSLAAEVDFCGLVSGRGRDKAAEAGLTLVPGAVVGAPIVEECPYNAECRVTGEVVIGEYVLVLGEVLETHAAEDVLDESGRMVDVGALDPLVYCPGVREYRGLTDKVGDAFSIGRSVGGTD